MKLSSIKGEEGHGQWLSLQNDGKRVRVWLDEVEQRNVTAFDDEAGWITRCVTDAEGRVLPDDSGEDIATETLRGRVRVEIG